MQDTLLIELLTEELPPKSLFRLGCAFQDEIRRRLQISGFLPEEDSAQQPVVRATPRRLAAVFSNVFSEQPDRAIERKGPQVESGLDANGAPTKALIGFARSCGVAPEALERQSDGKAEYFVFRSIQSGQPLAQHLERIVTESIKALPIPKLMRWGATDTEFVRPVQGLVMLRGSRVVPGRVLGSESGNRTRGHRFMGKGEITIPRADDYDTVLEHQGSVIACYLRRRTLVEQKLRERAEEAGGEVNLDERGELLDEVTSLVEWPAVYAGEFEREFLTVPQECLILTMQQNQKYFPLFDRHGKLLPKFLIVSNMAISDPSAIIDGNQRVVRARLADARFFFDHDRKEPLAHRVPRLGSVVYHNKLGTQLERVQRLTKLAGVIAHRLGADQAQAERAAYLCKADLATDMVGEFPELQGIMGAYYARHDGEPEPVANAIREHYCPRFANDGVPGDNVTASLALADKLDTLVGIYGIGLAPTGDKDPFALRRHALGVLRILLENALPLDLMELLTLAKSQFPPEVLADSVAVDVHQFMLERLRNYLRERDYDPLEVDAVLAQNPTRIDLVLPRLEAVRGFRRLPESESLAVANKRIRNILKKTEAPRVRPDLALLREPAEKALFDAMAALEPKVATRIANADYDEALKLLASAREPVDRFFDEVLVMCDEPLLRVNRLALLRQLGELMNQVADISKLAV